jgi:hypothetical protein
VRRNKKHTKIRYTGLFLGNDHEVQNIWSHEELDDYSKNINPLTEEDLVSVSDEGLRAYKKVNNYSIMYYIITIPEPHPLFNCHYIYSEEEFDFGRMQGVTKDHPINDAIEVIMDQVGPFFDSIEYVDVINRYTKEQ